MTLNTVFQETRDYEGTEAIQGEWFVATTILRESTLEQLDVFNETGALVLACRKGAWDSEFKNQDIELFLLGTPEQLAVAQEKYLLRPMVDAQLDCAEHYWG